MRSHLRLRSANKSVLNFCERESQADGGAAHRLPIAAGSRARVGREILAFDGWMGRFVHRYGLRDVMSGLPKRPWPRGDIRRVYLHWTAGDYTTTFPAYHVCVALDERGDPTAYVTSDVRANMRDVRATDRPYAAHTSGRNSYALGIAICGMADAEPHDFGAFSLLRDDMGLARVRDDRIRLRRLPVFRSTRRTSARMRKQRSKTGISEAIPRGAGISPGS